MDSLISTSEKKVISVRNPRTGIYDYEFKCTSSNEISEYCESMRVHQIKWENIGLEERIKILKEWQSHLIANKELIFEQVVHDTGRVRETHREVEGIINTIDKWSKIARLEYQEVIQETHLDGIKMMSDYKAYPLVGVISPWNFPLSLSLMDAIPALLSGCAVIIKPSEVTPRFVAPLMETISKVPVLRDILRYVYGDGSVGQEIIEKADMICFTGSLNTGRKVAVAAAQRLIPVFLELGGKDPAIVTKDVDIERSAEAVLVGSVLGVGHQCYSIERTYVDEAIMTEFIDCLVDKANKLNLNYPNVDQGEIGPIIFAPQAEIIQQHLEDAKAKGATIHCGGEIINNGGGLWCRPTVISNVSDDMLLMTEETFGPIMAIKSFKTLEEAIEMANDSQYGLSAAVLSGNLDGAIDIAKKLDAGGISINDTGLSPFMIGLPGKVEKTSFKYSGLGGSRLGSAAIKRFVRKKALIINENQEHSAWWYNVSK